MKSQTIRLIDVFLLGPLMVQSGMKQSKNLAGKAMIVFGIATIIYNWQNYQTERKQIV